MCKKVNARVTVGVRAYDGGLMLLRSFGVECALRGMDEDSSFADLRLEGAIDGVIDVES